MFRARPAIVLLGLAGCAYEGGPSGATPTAGADSERGASEDEETAGGVSGGTDSQGRLP